jgi:hypothetical protein
MERIGPETIRCLCPAIADIFVGREPIQCFQAPGLVVSHQEGLQVLPKLIVAAVVIAADSGFRQRSVHARKVSGRMGSVNRFHHTVRLNTYGAERCQALSRPKPLRLDCTHSHLCRPANRGQVLAHCVIRCRSANQANPRVRRRRESLSTHNGLSTRCIPPPGEGH